MNNNSVKCPICDKYVTISGINAHIDSNCQFNIVQTDGTVKDEVDDRNGPINSNHTHLSASSVEKKKTVQSTLFGQRPNRKRSNDDNLNENVSVHSISNFKSMENNNSNHSDKKMKIEEKISSPKFDINRKYDNNYSGNSNRINQKRKENKKQLPLAELVRPKTLDDYFGQEELMGENSILKTLIKENKVPSLIFWGPPGVGNYYYIIC